MRTKDDKYILIVLYYLINNKICIKCKDIFNYYEILVLKNVEVITILISMNAKKNVYMVIMMIIIIALYVKILINIMKMKFVLMNVHI